MNRWFKNLFIVGLPVTLFAVSQLGHSHHSYAIYDIDNRIELQGLVTKFTFASPHPIIYLEVTEQSGATTQWKTEAISLMRWRQTGAPEDLDLEGKHVSLTGWPARSGQPAMLLSSITADGEEVVVLERVMQRQAREAAQL